MADYPDLFELQDKLIEHKYPIIGIWEHAISYPGDIYRGLTKQRPDSGYVCQKIEFLRRLMEEQPLNQADFRDFNHYSNGEYYRESGNDNYEPSRVREKKGKFLNRIQQLKTETAQKVEDPVRKQCMLDSLKMIDALADYYEKTPSAVPLKQWRKLKRSVNLCLPTPCRKPKKRGFW